MSARETFDLNAFKTCFEIRGREISARQAPYLIAEMACAHDGDLQKAKALVDSAAQAGADAVQLQVFSVENQVIPSHSLHPLLVKLEFSAQAWTEIFAYAHSQNMAVFCFAYDIPSLQLALKLGIDGIKLSSADLSNPEMLQAAARSGLPITLGTGASTLDEIGEALGVIRAVGGEKVVLMHGVQNFPTALPDANLRHIQLLQRVFEMPIGYQDHTDAALEISKVMDLVALGMGVCMLEKHITLDRAEKGTDYQAALEPAEFKAWVATMRLAAQALGSAEIRPFNESDINYRKFQKKSIVAARALRQGETLTRDMVAFLRTGQPGLPPREWARLQGKPLARDACRVCALYPCRY
jgi:N,N'-diacetyllegionaminate synthase